MERQPQRRPGRGLLRPAHFALRGGDSANQIALARRGSLILPQQRCVGEEVGVQRRLGGKGRVAVVRGHEGRGQGGAEVLFQEGQQLSGEHVGSHHGVKPVVQEEALQPLRMPSRRAILRRAHSGLLDLFRDLGAHLNQRGGVERSLDSYQL